MSRNTNTEFHKQVIVANQITNEKDVKIRKLQSEIDRLNDVIITLRRPWWNKLLRGGK